MVTRKRILVVEDNDLNRAMLCEILSGEYSVLEACNGQEALDMLKKSQDSVSLILLDVMMPVMDGYHFLDRLRAEPELSLIPVIVMTQGSSEEDEVSALAHGATDFVPKPYRPQVILHRVASLIKLRETAAMVNQFQYDRLTGLYSKEFFYRKVRERLDANPEQAYTILCTNIENFKLYNDAFGRRAGDRLLKKVADVAKNMMGSHGFCGRYTADRFLCLQERTQEEQDWQDFGNFPLGEAQSFHNIVMRWGIYEITDPSVPVEQMCDRALLAVDSIKGQYDRYFAVYDDALRGRLFREKAITDAMETALAEEQFVIYLQPKYSLTNNCMAGAEALVRWIHPEWGFMSPGEFIPLRRTVLFTGWTNMSGSMCAPCLPSGSRRACPCCRCPSTCPGRTFIRFDWWIFFRDWFRNTISTPNTCIWKLRRAPTRRTPARLSLRWIICTLWVSPSRWTTSAAAIPP